MAKFDQPEDGPDDAGKGDCNEDDGGHDPENKRDGSESGVGKRRPVIPLCGRGGLLPGGWHLGIGLGSSYLAFAAPCIGQCLILWGCQLL